MKSNKGNKTQRVFGLAWFSKDDWPRLLEISEDRENLEETYEEWHLNAERAINDLKKNGVHIKKVNANPDEILIWCNKQGIPVNGDGRARFAAYKLHDKSKKGV